MVKYQLTRLLILKISPALRARSSAGPPRDPLDCSSGVRQDRRYPLEVPLELKRVKRQRKHAQAGSRMSTA
jgi:hypothetical protein